MTDGAGDGAAGLPLAAFAASYSHAHKQSNGVILLTNGAASRETTNCYSQTPATVCPTCAVGQSPARIAPK